MSCFRKGGQQVDNAHVRRHVACVAPLLVSCPLPRQGQPEVEQDMVVARDIAHKHPDLAGVDLAPVAAPLALHAHRMRAALGQTAGIESDDASGLPNRSATWPTNTVSNGR
jgi:hypothetical protein